MVKKASTGKLLAKTNLRTIIKSKFQFLAIILITAIAMTLYVGLTSNAKSINNRVNNLYEASNMADIFVTTKMHQESDYEKLLELGGKESKVEGRFVLPAKLQTLDANVLMSDKLPTISKPARTDNTDTENFLIIDERLLEEHKLASQIKWKDEDGNYLKVPIKFSIASIVEVMKTTLVPGTSVTMYDTVEGWLKEDGKSLLSEPYLTLNLQVTGSMLFAENVQSSQMNTSNFLLSHNYFVKEASKVFLENYDIPVLFRGLLTRALTEITAPNQYVMKVEKELDQELLLENINEYFKTNGKNNLIMANDLSFLPSNLIIQNDITQARKLAYIFPIIFFLVAILVVLTTTSQIILKERKEIGTMKALGLSKAKITLHYIFLSIYIVSIGILLGVILGPFIIPLIMDQKYRILYTLPEMKYTIAYFELFLSIVVVLGITALVTFLVTYKEASLLPSLSMRPKEIKEIKMAKKCGKFKKGSLPFKMALRNIRLNLVKSLMVVVGIAGCTGLLVCGFGIDDTLDKGLKTDEAHFFSADLYATYNSNGTKDAALSKVSGIESFEEYSALPANIHFENQSFQTMVTVFADDSRFINFDDYVLKDKAVISNKVSKELGLKVGDKFTFTNLGLVYEAEVGYVLESFYMHGIYLNQDYLNYGEIGKLKTNCFIDFKTDSDEKAVIDELLKIDGISSAKTHEENLNMVNSYMSGLSLMTLAVKVFAILLAMVVLYNLSLLNFKERTRDIATLKVLGFSKVEISVSLFFESIILTIVGVLFGLLLGLPLEILVLMVNLTPIVEFLYTVYNVSYLFAFLLTVLTAVLVNGILMSKIKSVHMVESLKSVE